ncbi:leucine-rich repeat-containing protein 41 isoform X2 [Sinocyclocheilus rhinocerous]|uniref:Leucine-rich repeat-containing protein 41 n=1 Tax=Sinocyclocheilus rhinocerous TaxID=307959 RepID=A0A673JC39_9TELE|nr:PREDICTED: leucine-rich repeat-containing protein 41-like isoform X2 [Sinocyclocheilus rhinocerous]
MKHTLRCEKTLELAAAVKNQEEETLELAAAVKNQEEETLELAAAVKNQEEEEEEETLALVSCVKMIISAGSSLVQMCIVKVAQNMDVLERKVSILPVSLLKDLLPHLNIYYLDRIETAAASKGISSSVVWAGLWRDLDQTWRWRLKSALPDQDWKQRCLERLFHMVLFTQVRRRGSYLSDLSDSSILSMTVKHVRVLSLHTSTRNICRLASGDLRPILSSLETRVTSLKLLDMKSLFKHGRKYVLFILHRLLDHGSVREVVLRRNPDSSFLSWLMSRCRGPQLTVSTAPETSHADGIDSRCRAELEEPAAKRLVLDVEGNPEVLCAEVSSSSSSADRCPEGQIHALDLEVSKREIMSTVSRILPTWLCLHTLHLHSDWLVSEQEMSVLVEALRRLFLDPGCSLTALSVSHVSGHTHLMSVLRACPTLQSLCLEICPPADTNTCRPQPSVSVTENRELRLEKLTVRSTGPMTVACFLPVLTSAPKLNSLHFTGIHLSQQFFRTLTGSNPSLKVLKLEDINLSDCHQEILQFLERSVLEELSFRDCRLLDKCAVKKDFLLPFVEALKGISSLRTLMLSQNRLATSAIEMAELFSGCRPSKITKLDLSSNFILPAELLEFAQLLETYRPVQRLTLDLRFNPLDRDPEVKGQALRKLIPYCNILTDDWDSRSTMADHISVM